MSTRRAARKQSLPKPEADVLNKLFDDELVTRLNQLFNAGWTLQAMGNAFTPPRCRSTVRSWMLRRHDLAPLDFPAIPVPKTPRGYISRRPVSPGISPADLARIKALAPIARTYRSRMDPSSPQALANHSLSELCFSLSEKNVTVKELAEATGVTYRAMARRLGR